VRRVTPRELDKLVLGHKPKAATRAWTGQHAGMTLRRTGTASAGSSVGATTSFWDLGILTAGPVSGLLAIGPGYPAAFLAAAAGSCSDWGHGNDHA